VPDTPLPAPPCNDVPTTETRIFEIDRNEVARADEWIEALGRRWGESPRTIFGARICVAELFANVIEHGIGKSDRDRITVTLARRHDGIGIEFLDTCARFDPTAVAAPVQGNSIESVTIDGRGLMLVRAYAKEFIYRCDSSGNRITLRIEAR
jgi:anti-sigma regulatory factor (Ser/Thr protein kinase)